MNRLKSFYFRWKRRIISFFVRSQLDLSKTTLISMNCIGGIVYHDCKARFLSPTIDLYFTPKDFLKFVNNLDYYLEHKPIVEMGTEFPIGKIDDISIHFMHYNTVEEALNKWEDRKKRINKDRIFVIMVERDGFAKEDFQEFQKISYPKCLFVKSKEYVCDDSVYLSQFRLEEQLPDIIPGRYMYSGMKLVRKIKKM